MRTSLEKREVDSLFNVRSQYRSYASYRSYSHTHGIRTSSSSYTSHKSWKLAHIAHALSRFRTFRYVHVSMLDFFWFLVFFLFYCAARNKFERFRGVLELNNRFEFEFCRCVNYFLKDSNFLVCSKFNHTQCGRTCACAVACLSPHNSISNVVVSLTIHDNVHMQKTCSKKKNMKPSWKVKGSFNRTSWKVSDVRIVRYTWILSLSLSLLTRKIGDVCKKT